MERQYWSWRDSKNIDIVEDRETQGERHRLREEGHTKKRRRNMIPSNYYLGKCKTWEPRKKNVLVLISLGHWSTAIFLEARNPFWNKQTFLIHLQNIFFAKLSVQESLLQSCTPVYLDLSGYHPLGYLTLFTLLEGDLILSISSILLSIQSSVVLCRVCYPKNTGRIKTTSFNFQSGRQRKKRDA